MAETVSEKALRQARIDKIKKLELLGVEPYAKSFDRSDSCEGLQTKYKDLASGSDSTDVVSVAGRVRAVRNNHMFIVVDDGSSPLQIFFDKERPEPQSELLKLLDVGDIIGVTGRVRRTPRGELTVDATVLKLLSKSLLPLPEKYHGLEDVEKRYRQRYLDLIVNPVSKKRFMCRANAVAIYEKFLGKQRLYGSGNSYVACCSRRSCGLAFCDVPQQTEIRSLHENRPRALPEKTYYWWSA